MSTTTRKVRTSGTTVQARPRHKARKRSDCTASHPADGVRVDPVPMDGMKTEREKAITHNLDGTPNEKGMQKVDVLRMKVRRQGVSGGGNHVPGIIVKRHGKGYGPCSRRQSKGKDKKSGSARGNLCHKLGVNPNISRLAHHDEIKRDLRRLCRQHMRMLDKRVHPSTYQHNRRRLLQAAPHLRQDVEHFEREHVRSFV